jgi:hypothetical protein
MPALVPFSIRLAVCSLALGSAVATSEAAGSFSIPRERVRRDAVEGAAGTISTPALLRDVPPTTQGIGPPIGPSVSTAGNLDGGGWSEQLFGNPNLGGGGGTCTIFFRGPGGTTLQVLHEPLFDGSGYGQSVTAADVNGDGFPDVIVGDPGQTTTNTNEGAIYVHYGTSLGVAPVPNATRSRGGNFASFGYSVSYAGDVNGDGFDDVLVGAPTFSDDQNNEGTAYLYLGGAAGLATDPVWEFTGDEQFAWFGFDVSAAGDVNGDGYDDIVVGQPFHTNGQGNEGAVWMFLGSSSGISVQTPSVFESDVASALLGYSVSAAGDANGDGYADYAAGAPSFSNGANFEGAVYLFEGALIPFFAPPPHIGEGATAGANLGADLAAGGDFNGDGLGDLIAGRPGYTDLSGNVGALDVMLGLGDLSTWPFSGLFSGISPGGGFGNHVGIGSDLDGDGFSDAITLEVPILRAPEGSPTQELVSVPGLTLGSIGFGTTKLVATSTFQAQAGYAVAADGDVNGDGFDDVLVGAPGHPGNTSSEGELQIFFGHPGGVGTEPPLPFLFPPPDWQFISGIQGATLGVSVAYAGDVNGDGYDDVIAGAPAFENGQLNEGAAFVFYGSASGPGTTPDWVVEGNLAQGQFGFSVAGAGDVNGDGFADVLVGAPIQSLGENLEGAAYLYYGSALGLSQAPARVFQGNVINREFGFTVAGLSDVDGDGLDDFAIGAPFYSNGQNNEGAVFAYKGAFAGPGAVWDVIESNVVDNYYGVAMARGGDVNRDGRGDLLIGNRYYSVSLTNQGSVEVFFGSASGFATVPDATITGGAQDDQFGYSVSTAGDINADGFSDILAGAPGASGNDGVGFIYLGAAMGASIFPAQQIYEGAGGRTGTSVAGGGDFNGDGFADAVVGSPLTAFGKGFQNGTVIADFPGLLSPDRLDHRPVDAYRPLADTPIGAGLRSDSPTSYRLRGRARSPMGRSRVRAEVESKLVGTAFNGLGLLTSAWTKTPSPVSGVPNTTPFFVNVTGLASNTKHHWRARYATKSIYYDRTPWWSPNANGTTQGDVRTAGGENVVAVDPRLDGSTLALAPARPNPSSAGRATTFAFALPAAGRVRVTLHDAAGRRVRTLLDRDAAAGPGTAAWDLADDAGVPVASGVYFALLSFAGETRQSKVVVLP